MTTFINHTNHPSANWSPEQKQAALAYGTITDMAMPELPAHYTEEQVAELTNQTFAKILALHPAAVLCQGEFTYTYGLVKRLKERGIPVLAACSERNVHEESNGSVSRKVSYFRFVQFRQY